MYGGCLLCPLYPLLSVGIISNDYFGINNSYSGLLSEAEYNVKNYAYAAEFNYHFYIIDSKVFLSF